MQNYRIGCARYQSLQLAQGGKNELDKTQSAAF